MKKVTIAVAILALVLMTTPAWATYTDPLDPSLQNEVINGDFQTGNFNGWVNDAITGHVGFTIADTYYAQSSTTYYTSYPYGYRESVMYQVIDESLSNGWNASGDHKDWWFTFKYRAGDSTDAEAYAFYYTSNPDTAPSFGGPDNPGAGWVSLYTDTSLANTSGSSWATVEVNGEIADFQPRWIAVAFEGTTRYSSGNTYAVRFDDVAFYGECEKEVVPVPPSLLLLGSGLLGVGVLRFRKN